MAALAVVLLTVWALVIGLRGSVAAQGARALVSVFVAPPAPRETKPPPRQPAASPRHAAKGDPSPRNRHNKATQVVAPVPFVPLAPVSIPTTLRAGPGG